jgi:hypothetical protein
MSSAGVTRRATQVVRDGVATFLAICGIVTVVIGLMYLVASGSLPHLLQGTLHSGHHLHRATICLAGGTGCLVVAWLIRVRHRT